MRHLRTGLTIFDEARATPGYTIFSPLGRNATHLINMHGQVVHEWRLPGFAGIYAYLLPNGNLLAAVQTTDGPSNMRGKGGHILELDWDGNTVWEHVDPFHHHDQRRCANGNTVYASWKLLSDEQARRVKGGREGTEHADGIYGDVLREIDREGNPVWEWEAGLSDEMYRYPINPICARVEFSHANAIVPLDNGDLLVNFRYNHLMAIIDRETTCTCSALDPETLSGSIRALPRGGDRLGVHSPRLPLQRRFTGDRRTRNIVRNGHARPSPGNGTGPSASSTTCTSSTTGTCCSSPTAPTCSMADRARGRA